MTVYTDTSTVHKHEPLDYKKAVDVRLVFVYLRLSSQVFGPGENDSLGTLNILLTGQSQIFPVTALWPSVCLHWSLL